VRIRSLFAIGTMLVATVVVPAQAAGAAPTTAAKSPVCNAVAQNEDAAHDGRSCTTLPAAPVQKWSVDLGSSASYPIIADGKVFVVTASSSGSYGGDLYALDATTGKAAWGPVPLSATYFWFALAFGDGNVYVNDFNGTVTAYNASTGSQVWAQTTSYFSGAPVVSNGVVYVQGPGPVYALSAKTGAILWTSGDLDGDGSSVSADSTGVYVAAGCSWFRLSLKTGKVLWSGNSGCDGGGGGTTYLADGLDFETVGDLIVNASTGHTEGTFTGTPAFNGDDGYFASGTSLFSENVSTRTPVFTTALPSDATTSPVIAGKVVYVGAANSTVYGVNIKNGKIVWAQSVPGVPGGGGQYSSPVSDIAVGNGLLVVPTGSTVTAFG
jgi:outer membrane protein assembly factor BamB